MQLSGISVRNIRSYDSAEVDLGPGTTLLVGDVGAGKSSLLFAVEMALFGFAEFDANYLIRHGARDAEVGLSLTEGTHTYSFHRRFRRREIRGRDAFQLESSSYAEDGATRRYSATELRLRTIELLGFPDNPNPRAHSDLWRWAVYVPQERMRQVLDQKPSERLETVRKALGLEQYRIARENAQLVAAELGRRAERHTDQASDLARRADDAPRWTGEIERSEPALVAAANERPTAIRALHDAGAAVARIEALSGPEKGLRSERESVTERVEQLGRILGRAALRQTELQTHRQRLAAEVSEEPQLVEALAVAQGGWNEARARRSSLALDRDREQLSLAAFAAAEADLRSSLLVASQLREDQARLDQAAATEIERTPRAVGPSAAATVTDVDRRTAAELTSAISNQQKELDACRATLTRSEVELRELDELLRQGECPRCHQPVRPESFAEHRSEVSVTVETARQRTREAEGMREQLERDLHRRQQFDRSREDEAHQIALRTASLARLKEIDEQRRSLGVRAEELRLAESVARDRISTLGPARGRLEEATRELARIDGELNALDERRLSLSRALAAVRGRAGEAAGLAEENERLRQEIGERESEREAARRRLITIEEELSRFASETARLPSLVKSREEAAQRKQALDERIGGLERTVAHAREQLLLAQADARRRATYETEAEQERATASWLQREFRDAMAGLEQRLLARAQGEFQSAFARFFHALVEDPALVARCDASFSPAVEIEGELTPPEALSGGERTALALAYRLSLGHVVRSFGQLTLSTLILDEPTDGFSPEQVGRMGELLDELRLPQVILVSHESGLASIADHVIRVRKVGGESIIEVDPGAARGGSKSPAPAVRALPLSSPRPKRARRTLESVAPPP